MRITPLDIRKQEFRRAMRGLDSEEVYAFLTTVADEYEAALSDNKALRERVLELDDKVQEYRSMERTLRDTLLTAERVTADAKENARREGDLIIKEAQIEAEKVLRDIKNQAMKLRQQVQELKRERESYLARMKVLAKSYLKFIEGEEKDLEEAERSVKSVVEMEQGKERADNKDKVEKDAEISSVARAEQSKVVEPSRKPSPSQQSRMKVSPIEPSRTALPPMQHPQIEPSPVEKSSSPSEPSLEEKHYSPSPIPQVPPSPSREIHKASSDVQPGSVPRDTATLKENTLAESSFATSDRSLDAILDRMVEGQRETLREDSGTRDAAEPAIGTREPVRDPEPTDSSLNRSMVAIEEDNASPGGTSKEIPQVPPATQQKASSTKGQKNEWSLEQIKRDILLE